MQTISSEAFSALTRQARVLETRDGRIVKLFRRKRILTPAPSDIADRRIRTPKLDYPWPFFGATV
ncbi:MAG TPA: hypothetical protein VI457_08500 [Methylococcaceae bacterium]|nr:hypothetical protein [Methylococcaceae bacterium]